jgi:DNA topoisomerase-2
LFSALNIPHITTAKLPCNQPVSGNRFSVRSLVLIIELNPFLEVIGMAQNFVGSNNVNLLVPSGQFGTRLSGGDDAASPRYIFTSLSPITRRLFPEVDDILLAYRVDDGQQIEPEFYCPAIPMLLVNGTHGTSFSLLCAIHIFNANKKQLVNYQNRNRNRLELCSTAS